MSLFIGTLAFTLAAAPYETQVKLGVLLGSLLSAVLATVLFLTSPANTQRVQG
jgi:NhaA family Na+:H+ antiporter